MGLQGSSSQAHHVSLRHAKSTALNAHAALKEIMVFLSKLCSLCREPCKAELIPYFLRAALRAGSPERPAR